MNQNNSVIPPLLSPDLTYTLPLNAATTPKGNPTTLHQAQKASGAKTDSGDTSSKTAELNKSGTGPKPENPPTAVKTGNSYPIEASNGKTVKPLEDGTYTITSRMSASRTLGGVTRPHNGVDLAAKQGTPIHAVKDGTIIGIKTETYRDARGNPIRNPDGSVKMKGYGNYVTVKHDDGTITRYAHMSSFNKNPDFKVGQKIGAGTVLGEVGHTGRSFGRTGNHLHFELRDKNNKPLAPYKFIE